MKKDDPTTERARERLSQLAERYFEKGDYVSALRFVHKEIVECGTDVDNLIRLADIYETMGLHELALNYWYRVLDVCAEADFPDVYEGLATNYLSVGDEQRAAFYYNRLIDADSMISEEFKEEVAQAFSKDKSSKFKVVYPSDSADYSKEVEEGSLYLKNGNIKRAIEVLGKVEAGSKEYAKAREMQAVAYLLAEQVDEAEKICLELVEKYPDSAQALSTLAAVYMEKGEAEKCRAIAVELCKKKLTTAEEKYKVATVACEAELHEEAYRLFAELEEEMPYDQKVLYFQAVAAYKCGEVNRAIALLEKLCILYPKAVVARYYLEEIKKTASAPICEAAPTKNGFSVCGYSSNNSVDIQYYYRLPIAEKERRIGELFEIEKLDRKRAKALGKSFWEKGYFDWCFDEMDGMDRDLQFLALTIAEYAFCDEFLREKLLDKDLPDVLKVEILRELCKRNVEDNFGVVLYHIYREVPIHKIVVGRKARNKFLEGYASVYSKLAIVKDENADAIADAAEKLYFAIEEKGETKLFDDENATSCAIFVLSGVKEFGSNAAALAKLFETDQEKVEKLLEVYYTVFEEE